jgi:hypothetical protein
MDSNKPASGHNRLYQMLKSKSKFKSTSNLDESESASPASRGNVFSRLLKNRNVERRDQRDKMLNQNRVLATPNKQTTQSTANLSTKKPTSQATTARNQNAELSKNKSVFKSLIDTKTSILNKFPTRKPAMPIPATASTPMTSSNAATSSTNNTYLVHNDLNNMSMDSLNCSSASNTTVGNSNRRRILEEWRKEKMEKEAREKALKAQKPAFKAGASVVKLPPGPALPTSSTFNFHVIF